MKRICIIALMAIGVMTAILSAGEPAKLTDEQLKSIRINGSTNKSALSYLENEPMIFTFKVESGSLPLDGYFLSGSRRRRNRIFARFASG